MLVVYRPGPYMFCHCGHCLAADVGRHGAAPATSGARADRIHSQIQMGQGPVVVKLCDLTGLGDEMCLT